MVLPLKCVSQFENILSTIGVTAPVSRSDLTNLGDWLDQACQETGHECDALGLIRTAESLRDTLYPNTLFGGRTHELTQFRGATTLDDFRWRALALFLSETAYNSRTEIGKVARRVLDFMDEAGLLAPSYMEF